MSKERGLQPSKVHNDASHVEKQDGGVYQLRDAGQGNWLLLSCLLSLVSFSLVKITVGQLHFVEISKYKCFHFHLPNIVNTLLTLKSLLKLYS